MEVRDRAADHPELPKSPFIPRTTTTRRKSTLFDSTFIEGYPVLYVKPRIPYYTYVVKFRTFGRQFAWSRGATFYHPFHTSSCDRIPTRQRAACRQRRNTLGTSKHDGPLYNPNQWRRAVTTYCSIPIARLGAINDQAKARRELRR